MHQYGKNAEATDAIDFLQSRVIFVLLKYIKNSIHSQEIDKIIFYQ